MPLPRTAASRAQPVCAAMACPAVSVSQETRFSLPSRCSTTTRIVSAIRVHLPFVRIMAAIAAKQPRGKADCLSPHGFREHALAYRALVIAEPEQEQSYYPGSHHPPQPEKRAAAETHPDPHSHQQIEDDDLPADGDQNGAQTLRVHGLVAAVFVPLNKVAHNLLD